MKIGYRDRVVPNEEMACAGCLPENLCRYHVIRCVTEKGISDCGKCRHYPCPVIERCFAQTESFAPACEKACTREEYEMLIRAFFEKKKNLDRSAEERTAGIRPSSAEPQA